MMAVFAPQSQIQIRLAYVLATVQTSLSFLQHLGERAALFIYFNFLLI